MTVRWIDRELSKLRADVRRALADYNFDYLLIVWARIDWLLDQRLMVGQAGGVR